MVQSVCLTSRGSGVRLPLLPPCDCFLLYPASVSGDPRPGKQNLIIRKKIFRSERTVCRENFVNSAPMGNMAAARPYRLVVHLSYNLCFTCHIIDL